MRKAGAIFFVLLVGLTVLLTAQEEDDDPSVEIDWDEYSSDLYARGDQTFIISLGTVFPTVFLNNGNFINHNFNPPVGGTGSLVYNYYLNSHFFAGVEVGGMFIPTLGGNMVFIIPLGVRAGYQFNIWKLEFPITVTLGMTWHNYLNKGYYGLYIKSGAAAFFRATSTWSFGLTSSWGWFPEWTSDQSKNVDGNIVDLMLSARYHF